MDDGDIVPPCDADIPVCPVFPSIGKFLPGIAFGIVSHVLIKLASGKAAELKSVALIFILTYLLL
ncbi:MAG: hypothetical protein K9M45_05770 [Kiritimatiellales bacterium]|nr:hypothetical protein [Kiritimatiellales bacterium]